MACDQNITLVAYLDGELSGEQKVALQQHISGCTECAAEVAALMSLRRSMIAARNNFVPSAEFRRKIQQQIAAPKPRAVWLQWPRWTPLVASLAAVLLLAVGWMQYGMRGDVFGEVADLHVNTMASANPLDVISTDRHTVKPWFQGRIPFSFNVPEFAGTEFTLLGGRMVYMHQQPGAQLIVGRGQHKISVLILQDSAAWDREFAVDAAVKNRHAFNVTTWQSQGLRFFVIGDTDAAAIARLSQTLKQVNE